MIFLWLLLAAVGLTAAGIIIAAAVNDKED